MKLAIIALVLALSLASSEAWWGYGYGGLYGGLWGGMYGGLWGGWGYGGLWGKRAVTEDMSVRTMALREVLNRTECVYTRKTEMLSCKGTTGIVECQADLELGNGELDFTLFGISELADGSFQLVPRRLDNTAWDFFLLDGVKVPFKLWLDNDVKQTGIEVEESVCWERIVSLLRQSVRREKVLVLDETFTLIGDLLIAEDIPKVKKDMMKKEVPVRMPEDRTFYSKRTGMPAVTERELIAVNERIMKKNQESCATGERCNGN